MWAKLRAVFGSNKSQGDNVQLASRRAMDGSDGSDDDGPLSSTADQLTLVRSQIGNVRLQLESTSTTLQRVSLLEDQLASERACLLMQCHDAYLHPQLDGEPTAVADGDVDGASPLYDLVPMPAAERQDRDKVRAIAEGVIAKRAALSTDFDKTLGVLRRKREYLEDVAFKLQLRLEKLDGIEQKLEAEFSEVAPPARPRPAELEHIVVSRPISPRSAAAASVTAEEARAAASTEAPSTLDDDDDGRCPQLSQPPPSGGAVNGDDDEERSPLRTAA